MSKIHLPWGFDAEFLFLKQPPYFYWKDYHTLISGATGSGKTIASALLLARIAKYIPESKLYLLDYKADDFYSLLGSNHYYPYDAVFQGVEDFDRVFLARQKREDSNRQPLILYIDELGAMLSALDKKQADEFKKLLGKFLMLGRSLGVIVIVGIQRPDSTYFSAGVRDNFNSVLALGNLSKEGKQMIFPDYKEEIQKVHTVGEGYFQQDSNFYHVQMPDIQRLDILIDTINGIVQ